MARISPERIERNRRVEAALGDGRVICARCGATLANMANLCTADLVDPCPGFVAIELAITGDARNVKGALQ